MHLKRFWRHILMNPVTVARCFPATTLDAIQREVAVQEKRHRGEICFVVEAELTSGQLWRDVSSRMRAREVFALHGAWNTEENNGVLIYVLLADRRVEIVADRGIDSKVSPQEWQSICRAMEKSFAEGRYEEGAIEGARRVSELLGRHFPPAGTRRNELGDRPVLM
ncbi:MAG: TPM domain-containing protein [Usitatibacter sp.]